MVTKIVIYVTNADRFLYNTNAPFAMTTVGVDAIAFQARRRSSP
ncbi:hypothetical protein [Nostoc sp. XA010]|nr:hypothetical protein [Nostoc sp. XA010]